jgi:hypothetical protein
MPEEKPAPETPATEPTEKPAEQKKVKVTLKVAMSEADVGKAAVAGDEVEVDADVAERWIAAGIAEAAGGSSAPSTPSSSSSSTPSSRRSGTA